MITLEEVKRNATEAGDTFFLDRPDMNFLPEVYGDRFFIGYQYRNSQPIQLIDPPKDLQEFLRENNWFNFFICIVCKNGKTDLIHMEYSYIDAMKTIDLLTKKGPFRNLNEIRAANLRNGDKDFVSSKIFKPRFTRSIWNGRCYIESILVSFENEHRLYRLKFVDNTGCNAVAIGDDMYSTTEAKRFAKKLFGAR